MVIFWLYWAQRMQIRVPNHPTKTQNYACMKVGFVVKCKCIVFHFQYWSYDLSFMHASLDFVTRVTIWGIGIQSFLFYTRTKEFKVSINFD